MAHPNEQETHSGCKGCGCFALPFLPFLMLFGTIWPTGALLRMGHWVQNTRNGKTSWSFYFEPEFATAPYLIAILFVLEIVILYKVLDRFFTGEPIPPHPLLHQLVQPHKGAESWRKILDSKKTRVLLEYHSGRETKQAWELWPVFAGVGSALFGPLLAGLIASSFLAPEALPARSMLLLGFYLTAVAFLIQAFKVKERQTPLDDRLILDFEKREVQKIALHDLAAKPERWFGFDQIHRAVLTKARKYGEIRHSTLKLETRARDQEFSLFTNSRGDREEVAREIAELFDTELEVVVRQIRNS